MTYSAGKIVQAGDYLALAGFTGSAAASSAAATNVAGYLWGIGYGDRGYGETSPGLSAPVTNDPLLASRWTELRAVLNNIAAWQGTSVALLPPNASLSAGASDIAFTSGSGYDIPTLLSNLDTNRLNFNPVNMTVTANAASSTRSTTWGAGSTSPGDSITCDFLITFSSEDAARYFFNSGGEIRLSLNHPDTTTLRNSSWNTVLSNFSCAIRAHSTARIGGSYGTGQSIGYYELTTSYQNIIDGTNTGISPYAVNDFYVKAMSVTGPQGSTGGNGAQLKIQAVLVDEQTNAYSDIVAAGTSATVSFLRATSVITPKDSPVCSVAVAFG